MLPRNLHFELLWEEWGPPQGLALISDAVHCHVAVSPRLSITQHAKIKHRITARDEGGYHMLPCSPASICKLSPLAIKVLREHPDLRALMCVPDVHVLQRHVPDVFLVLCQLTVRHPMVFAILMFLVVRLKKAAPCKKECSLKL